MAVRLDKWLVEEGLVGSRTSAQKLIAAGQVLVGGKKITKEAHPVEVGTEVQLISTPRFVSRGGEKLQAALEHFSISPKGLICLDVGISTGGFADCLLQNGALSVIGVDTGRDQLSPTLKSDPRITLFEHTNFRHVPLPTIGIPNAKGQFPQLGVIDVSFVSVTLLLPALRHALCPHLGELIILIKPQFELSPSELSKGGLVKEVAKRKKAVEKVLKEARSSGFVLCQLMESPLKGGDGNTEYLAHFSAHEKSPPAQEELFLGRLFD